MRGAFRPSQVSSTLPCWRLSTLAASDGVTPANQNPVLSSLPPIVAVDVPVLPAIRLEFFEYQLLNTLADVPPDFVSPVSRLIAVRAIWGAICTEHGVRFHFGARLTEITARMTSGRAPVPMSPPGRAAGRYRHEKS